MQKTKLFVWNDTKPPITYRPGTSDEAIIQSILVNRQEYMFPILPDVKLIYDIGANIGVVSVILANIYPNARIYSFEPVEENYNLLVENAQNYPNIRPMKCGLGSRSEALKIFKSDDPTNLGGFSTHIGGEIGETISVVKTETICQEFGVPDVIKIDCEGAEYDILKDMPDLGKVRWIAGELHGINDYRLLDLLDTRGFSMAMTRDFNDKCWHFHALNKKTDLSIDPTPL